MHAGADAPRSEHGGSSDGADSADDGGGGAVPDRRPVGGEARAGARCSRRGRPVCAAGACCQHALCQATSYRGVAFHSLPLYSYFLALSLAMHCRWAECSCAGVFVCCAFWAMTVGDPHPALSSPSPIWLAPAIRPCASMPQSPTPRCPISSQVIAGAGALAFCTAGGAPKRLLLRRQCVRLAVGSRDTAFTEDVLLGALASGFGTAGGEGAASPADFAGVDVVLNSLTSPGRCCPRLLFSGAGQEGRPRQ